MDYKELVENAKVYCGDIEIEECPEHRKNPYDKRSEDLEWCRPYYHRAERGGG